MTDEFLKWPFPPLNDQLGPVSLVEVTMMQEQEASTGPFGLPRHIRQQLERRIDPLFESVMLDLGNVLK